MRVCAIKGATQGGSVMDQVFIFGIVGAMTVFAIVLGTVSLIAGPK